MKSSVRSSQFFKPFAWVGLLASLALVLAACSPAASSPSSGGYGPAPTSAPAATSAPVLSPSLGAPTAPVPVTGGEAALAVATDPNLGKILVDGKGRTLYAFMKDTPDKSNCSAGCLKAWPPLQTQGQASVGAGVDASLLGSTSLPDGSKIVTYNHMPLYYFAGDAKPGDVNGQGSGNVWFVVSPDGKTVGASSSSATPASSPSMAAPGGGTMATPGTSATKTSPGTYAGAGAGINVATDPKLGKILVGANGMTLYAFGKDAPDQSNCNAACLQNWPPLTSQAQPALGEGVNASLVGTASLPDGTKIVTYNHMPLYFFAKDTKPGDVNGQDVGGVWYVVSPDGKTVE